MTQASGSPFVVGFSVPQSVAAGDFNGDGIADFATANGANTVSILLGNGSATQSIPVVTSASSVGTLTSPFALEFSGNYGAAPATQTGILTYKTSVPLSIRGSF